MADILDQINDRYVGLEHAQLDSNVHEMTVIVHQGGSWHQHTMTGRPSDVIDQIEKLYGPMDKYRWARGYRKPDGSVVIHPKSDKGAEEEMMRRMGLDPKTRRR